MIAMAYALDIAWEGLWEDRRRAEEQENLVSRRRGHEIRRARHAMGIQICQSGFGYFNKRS